MNAFAHKIVPTGNWLFWVFCFCFVYNLTTNTLMLIELRQTKPYKLSHKLYTLLSVVELIITFNIPLTLLVPVIRFEKPNTWCESAGNVWHSIITGLFGLSNGILVTINVVRYLSIKHSMNNSPKIQITSYVGLIFSIGSFFPITFLSIHKYSSLSTYWIDVSIMNALYIIIILTIITLNIRLYVHLKHTTTENNITISKTRTKKAMVTLMLISAVNIILTIPFLTSSIVTLATCLHFSMKELIETFYGKSAPVFLGIMFNGGINSHIYICRSRKWISKIFRNKDFHQNPGT